MLEELEDVDEILEEIEVMELERDGRPDRNVHSMAGEVSVKL